MDQVIGHRCGEIVGVLGIVVVGRVVVGSVVVGSVVVGAGIGIAVVVGAGVGLKKMTNGTYHEDVRVQGWPLLSPKFDLYGNAIQVCS